VPKVSQRGVVYFRSQTNLTNELQKRLILRLGELTTRPSANTVHIHPVLNDTSEFGVGDHEISTISSLQRKKLFSANVKNVRKYDAAQWHSDIQFEPCPADYTSLRLVQLPSNGGDTLWASGYDLYDRLSKPFQNLLDSLTATFVGQGFLDAEREGRTKIYTDPRGAPENVGGELTAVHPVVRTNPVTGWKSVFAVGTFPKRINEVTGDESDELLAKLKGMVAGDHGLQVRFKWKGEHDIGERNLTFPFWIW
jgi:alpha-ketoglutarate-dependent taurine dioxygenase